METAPQWLTYLERFQTAIAAFIGFAGLIYTTHLGFAKSRDSQERQWQQEKARDHDKLLSYARTLSVQAKELAKAYKINADGAKALDEHYGGVDRADSEIAVRVQLFRVAIPESFSLRAEERLSLPIDVQEKLAKFESQASMNAVYIDTLVMEAALEKKKLAMATPLKSLTESLTRCQFMLEELADELDIFLDGIDRP